MQIPNRVLTTLGLPTPARLKRRGDREDVLDPVVVLGSSDGADQAADLLLDWGADVRRRHEDVRSVGSLLLVLDDLADPSQLSPLIEQISGSLKKLAPSGRVLTISRLPAAPTPAQKMPTSAQKAPAPAGGTLSSAENAARGAVEGLLRSLAHEMRGGATANGIQLADGVGLSAPSAQHALRFLLSPRSAFIDGQFIRVTSEAGTMPADPARPLTGLTIAVTGAARGIGEAIARTLAQDGARLVLIDVMAAGTELSRLAVELNAIPLIADVTAAGAGSVIAEACRTRGLPLDGIVHNAGITRDKLLANMTQDRWDAVLGVNLMAQLQITEALRSSDVLGEQFRHVGIASTSGIAGNRGQTNYAASKAGVIDYVRSLAGELASSGGTANAIAPGFIETEMTAKMPFITREVARRLNSLSQGGKPVDVAEAVAFMLSPAAGGIQGETLRVCGQNLVGQ